MRITICGLAELPDLMGQGVTHLLSILDPGFPIPDALAAGEHARLELRFHDIIENEPGLLPPRAEHVAEILAFGRDLAIEPGASLLVHCHAGISRSTAATLLVLAQAEPSASPDALAETLLATRAHAWPNLRIVELGDAELGRGGKLTDAAVMLYRAQLRRRPELAELMSGGGRGREVRLAQSP